MTATERRRVKRLLLTTFLLSLATTATMLTDAAWLFVPAALVAAVWTAIVAFKVGQRGSSPSVLGERLVFVFVVWFATLQVAFMHFNFIGFSSGASEPLGLVALLLGLPWSFAAVGMSACGQRRVFDLERLHARLPRNACWALAPRWWLPGLLPGLALALALAQWAVGGGVYWSVATFLSMLAGGAAFVQGLPRLVASRVGQLAFLAWHVAACVAAAPFFSLLVLILVELLPEPGISESDTWVQVLTGFATAFCLLGTRLLFLTRVNS